MFARIISILSGLALVAGLFFGAGMWTTYKNWWPWQKIFETRTALRPLKDTGKMLPPRSYSRRSAEAADQRYTVFEPSRISDGYLAVTRVDLETAGYVTDLLDSNGQVIQSWIVSFADIMEGGNRLAQPHATKVMPDGTLLISFDDDPGLARLDACGGVIWADNDAIYHHVLAQENGSFWIWKAKGGASTVNQQLYRFDPENGQPLETIDLIDDVIGNDTVRSLWMAVPPGYEYDREAKEGEVADIFHPNDIEPLPAEYSASFPQFNTGDLLISLRNIDLVAVVDRQTGEMKWASRGPWLEQHDPDWQADGTITVLSNNPERGRSTLVRMDPTTKEADVMFDDGGPKFFTTIMGAHQRLKNGNWLIVSSMEGRVLEVDGDGNLLREYSNNVTERYNGVIPFAEFLPSDYFSELPKCSED